MNAIGTPRWFALLVLSSLNHGIVSAQSLSNLAGTWNTILFSTPSALVLDRNQNGQVTNVGGRNNFQVQAGPMTMDGSGHAVFAGGSAEVSVGTQGVIQAAVSTGEHLAFFVNAAQDLMVCAHDGGDHNSHDFNVFVKAPASLTAADIVGDWSICAMDTPAEIYQTLGGTSGVLQDVGPAQGFGAHVGTMTVAAGGTMSGNLFNPFTGTWALAGGGGVNANIVNGPSLTFYVNSSKDVMIAVDTQVSTTDNQQELLVFAKVPIAVSTAELAGVWKINTLQTPSQLTVDRDGQNNVTNVRETQDFHIAQQGIVVGNDGYLVGNIPDAATGTLVPGAGGAIAVTINKPGQPPQNLTLYLNAGKNLMTGLITSANGQEFLLVTKAPDVPGTVDFGLQYSVSNGQFILNRAANTGRVLQYCTDLDHWSDVPSTQGGHTYSATMSATPNGFFRLIQRP